MRECYTRADIEPGQLFERNGEIFRVVGIIDEPTVEVEHLITGKLENHAITCRNFSEFRRLDDRKEIRESLCGAIEKLLEKMKDDFQIEQAIIAGKILGIIKEIKNSES